MNLPCEVCGETLRCVWAASSVAIMALAHPSAAYGYERISDDAESIAIGWQHLFRKAFP